MACRESLVGPAARERRGQERARARVLCAGVRKRWLALVGFVLWNVGYVL
jgi:hypothetical protein